MPVILLIISHPELFHHRFHHPVPQRNRDEQMTTGLPPTKPLLTRAETGNLIVLCEILYAYVDGFQGGCRCAFRN